MHAADVADVASAALANVVVANVAIFTIRPARGADADPLPSQASIIAVFTAALSCASSSLVSLPSRSRRHHIDHTHGFDRIASHPSSSSSPLFTPSPVISLARTVARSLVRAPPRANRASARVAARLADMPFARARLRTTNRRGRRLSASLARARRDRPARERDGERDGARVERSGALARARVVFDGGTARTKRVDGGARSRERDGERW
jgi:hypothetical protein